MSYSIHAHFQGGTKFLFAAKVGWGKEQISQGGDGQALSPHGLSLLPHIL